MKDLLRKTLETVNERISSPMLSSTAVAWAAVNYKFLLVVLSADDFRKKFDYIESILYPTPEIKLKLGVLYPISFGLFYTVVYPLIDIGLASIREVIDNLKERAILFVSRVLKISASPSVFQRPGKNYAGANPSRSVSMTIRTVFPADGARVIERRGRRSKYHLFNNDFRNARAAMAPLNHDASKLPSRVRL
ncbi:hypothetical protein [Zoogloea sp.]|uniref:hypothetical protein n=1 Tax=Zoogloea sp. TaxID=49181 RepID=UPI001D65CBEA|nr:hypothetical protein [Zoogloea sp.]MBK6654058.1 hypothetical protein [Zoogloea sp.]